MELKVILALLCGFLMGCGFVYFCFRRGLTALEWAYFREFLDALRAGEYDEIPDEERSEKDGEQD